MGTGRSSELVEIFSAFCGSVRFNIMFARAHHWTITWTRGIESTSSCSVHVTFILILPSHLYLCLSVDFLQHCRLQMCMHVFALQSILCVQLVSFLGAFAKLRKVAISFVMSDCPSVRMEQLGFHWTDIH